jgi:hypothetical protein
LAPTIVLRPPIFYPPLPGLQFSRMTNHSRNRWFSQMPWNNPTRIRQVALAVYLLGTLALLVWSGRSRFDRHGDGWEYYVTLEAFDRHGTFDIQPGDRQALFDEIYVRYHRPPTPIRPPEALAAVAGGSGLVPERARPLDIYAAEMQNGFLPAIDGRSHALHFWAYPLSAYPAKRILRLVGGWEFNALKVTNSAFFALAIGIVLFRRRGSIGWRILFALLLGVSPAIWYIPFTGAELFSWSLCAISITCLDDDRHAWSALTAGLAATQNPPLVLLAAVPVLLALMKRSWLSAILACIGASTAFLPVVYYLYHFGQPSLITRQHTNIQLISLERTLCLFFDWNVGLLPYVPVLVLAFPLAGFVLLVRRDFKAIFVLLAFIGMLLGVQVQVNWNSDCRGILRYLVWMLPLLAWLIMRSCRGGVRFSLVLLAVVVTAAIVTFDPPTPSNSLEHRPLARWFFVNAPWTYNPVQEIFIERAVHSEQMPLEDDPSFGPNAKIALPVAVGRTNGEVTKLLVHRESAARLTARFQIDPAYLPELLRIAAANTTPVYVHPPRRTVYAIPWTIHGTYDAQPDVRPIRGVP